jgi:hypothetical protein
MIRLRQEAVLLIMIYHDFWCADEGLQPQGFAPVPFFKTVRQYILYLTIK